MIAWIHVRHVNVIRWAHACEMRPFSNRRGSKKGVRVVVWVHQEDGVMWGARGMQVYGAVTMNNTLCLGLFLLVMYKQQLEWVYSSEVTIIVGAPALPCSYKPCPYKPCSYKP